MERNSFINKQAISNFLQGQENQQVRASLSSTVLSILCFAISYAMYKLLGEYLSTFFFMFISAIALSGIKRTFIEQLRQATQFNRQYFRDSWAWVSDMSTMKFSFTTKMLLYCFYSLSQFSRFKQLLTMLYERTINATILYFAFTMYIIYKNEWYWYVLALDVVLWLVIDLIQLVLWVFTKLLKYIRRQTPQKTPSHMRFHDRKEKFINYLENSTLFNHFLFCFFAILIMIMIPISMALIYSDLIVYKTHVTPIISNLNLTESAEVQEYLKPEFYLKQLEGTYVSENLTKQIYQIISYNQTEADILKVLFGDDYIHVRIELNQCVGKTFCKLGVMYSERDKLNYEFQEYVSFGVQYLKTYFPQIKSIAALTFSYIITAFAGSMTLLFKVLLFYQGVIYLMNQQSLKLSQLIILGGIQEIRHEISQQIHKHITGVFVSLTLIFIQHFMLSYMILDIISIKLAFIVSLFVAIFSLTQLISPSVFFGIIVLAWYIAGKLVADSSITVPILVISNIVFFFMSGQVYTYCFEAHLGDPFWIGISVILGYISFEWKGIIYGPLLVGSIRIVSELIRWYQQDDQRQHPQAEHQQQQKHEDVAKKPELKQTIQDTQQKVQQQQPEKWTEQFSEGNDVTKKRNPKIKEIKQKTD